MQSLAAARVRDRGEDQREERKRGCDEGMWTYGHPFIRLSGPTMVTVKVRLGIAS
jgi:hypothetical protein